jgi:Ca-activated chloride channel family protein
MTGFKSLQYRWSPIVPRTGFAIGLRPSTLIPSGFALSATLLLILSGGCSSLDRAQQKNSAPSISQEQTSGLAGSPQDQALSELAAPPPAASTPKTEADQSQANAPALPTEPETEGGAVPEANTEEYDRIYENPFLAVVQNPLSTFSIDVDTASYANSRRFLNDNQLPPPDAVRLEEFINYFEYDYPKPTGADPFSITTELGDCPWNRDHQLLLVGLQGKVLETEQLPPNNLVFLLDVSGSMDEPNKLPLLKSALKLLVEQLGPDDQVSVVVYAGAAGVVLEPTAGNEGARIMDAIDNLQAGGSTAGGEGIELAYKLAKENFKSGGNNRVILATDGDFNVGPSSDAALVRLIEEKRKEGVFLTVLGFGSGNYKDAKMEKLADMGNGNYAYLDSILEAKKALVTEMGGTLNTIAKDVKFQIEFNPSVVKGYRLLGYENRVLKAEDFNDDRKDAGELGSGHSVTALYELIPAGSSENIPGVDPLKYQNTTVLPNGELMTLKLRYKQPGSETSKLLQQAVKAEAIRGSQPSLNYQFASAVTEFGLLLRRSDYKGNASYTTVLTRAKASLGPDLQGYRAEFLGLVEKAQQLDRE